jgi:hypothetical protein
VILPDRTPGRPVPDSCREGLYQGDFAGVIYTPGETPPAIGDPDATVRGPIEVRLSHAAGDPDNFLRIDGGHLMGNADGIIPFAADLEGMLDCPGRRLDARIVDGMASLGGLPVAIPFEGNLVGAYLPAEQRFVDGVWDAMDTGIAPGGGGPIGGPLWLFAGIWSAAWVGP